MTDRTQLQKYIELSDRLVEIADKEQLAECATILAMNVAHYQMEYGELPLDEVLTTTSTGIVNDQQNELLTKGMETMVSVLNNIIEGFEDKVSH
jgi:hypothetical protein